MSGHPDRRTLLLCAAAAVSAAGFRFALASAASSPTTLIRRGDRLFVSARVNDIAVEGLLDSAAETTLVSPAFAARLGLASGPAVDAHGSGAATFAARLTPHVRIAAAGVEVPDATVAVVDLADVGRRLAGRTIQAVIGREIFDAARLQIDIGAGVIRPAPAGASPLGVKLPLVDDRGLMLMPISIESHAPALAEFDLGNGTGVLVSRRYATRIGLFDGRPVSTRRGGGLGGAKPRQGLIVRSLSLAGRTLADVHVDIDDAADAHDANIGVDVLQHFRITTDFARHELWLRPV